MQPDTLLTNNVRINSLGRVLGGLLDDLAVDLISEEFLLFSQLKQNTSHNISQM